MTGLFGGSFDPIHAGHIHLLRSILDKKYCKKIFVVPTSQNPLKGQPPIASAEERLAMVKLAIEEAKLDGVEILDWEIRNDGPAFTVNTVRRLAASLGTKPVLIIGDELFETLPQWREPRELLSAAKLLVVSRHGGKFDPAAIIEKLGAPIPTQSIDYFPLDALPHSSTQLRKEISNAWRKSTLDSTPQGIGRSVWLFIKEKKLYAVTERVGLNA